MITKRIHVTTKTWQSEGLGKFPEADFIKRGKDGKYGLAFSGGGNRSASLTVGYLRALHKLGIIDRIGYISGVSGGAWAALPYTYLDKCISDNDFLGAYFPPDKLTFDQIKNGNTLNFTYAVSQTRMVKELFSHLFSGDELFAAILNDLFLKPYLISDREKFFSYTAQTISSIINQQRDGCEIRASDFYPVRDGRPFLIVNGVLSRSFFNSINRFPFEITPLYVGVPMFFQKGGSLGSYHIGGGYVEPFGFDSDSPDVVENGMATVRIKYKSNVFALSDVLATTGSAPAEYLDKYLVNIGFPEFKYWSPKEPQDAKEYDFVDGGYMDNTGIIPLLRRDVDRIVVFVNTDSDLVHKDKDSKEEVSQMIKSLFVQLPDHHSMKDYDKNKVFEGGQEQFDSLKSKFIALNKAGKPAVVKESYTTIENKTFGVEAGKQVEVVWVHNAYVSEWTDQLTDLDLKKYVLDEAKNKNFPNYSTFFTDGAKIIDVDWSQANLMAQLASYVIDSNSGLFQDFLP